MRDGGQLDALAFLRLRRGLDAARARLAASDLPRSRTDALRRRLAQLAATGSGDLERMERELADLEEALDRLLGPQDLDPSGQHG